VRVKVSVLIDQEIYKKAHELGINVSKVCENQLAVLIHAIEGSNGKTKPFLSSESYEVSQKVRLPGFEPGSSTWQRGASVDWVAFEKWISEKKYRGSGARTIISYATRYHPLLLNGELGKLSELPDTQRPMALKALCSLSKFLGCYEQFQQQRKAFGLTWTGKSADELVIDRLNKVGDADQVFSWIREVKELRPELTEFLDLMAVTGLRMVEAVNSYKLIIDLVEKNQLDKYFNAANSTLEHYRFKDLFLRKSKKAFVSFVPLHLVGAIGDSVLVSTSGAISKSLYKQGLKPRFGDVRENHASFMTKYLKESEINFLHGRVTSGVFMQHYFNPALISDLKARAFQGIVEIQEKVKL
jgi:hypothetical protein